MLMNKIQIILLLSIVIVVLLLIDAFRRSKRRKYKKQMAELTALQAEEEAALKPKKLKATKKLKKLKQTKQAASDTEPQQKPAYQDKDIVKIELGQDIKIDPFSTQTISEFEASEAAFPSLAQGYAILYLNMPRGNGFLGQDVKALFKKYRLEFSAEGSAQFLTEDRDVLYSIVPDNEMRQFQHQNFESTHYNGLIYVFNIHKIAKCYDVAVCFNYFIKVLYEMNTRLGGVILNEHRQRFTKSDELGYRRHIKQYDASHRPQP